MTIGMKIRILVAILAFLPLGMFATVAKPGIGLVGDEFMHYREGEQPPVELSSEEYMTMRRLPGVQRSSFPTKGEVRSLVILVNFSDLAFVTPDANAAFTRMLNTSGYSENNGTGSARDYFIASSDSLFKPTFDVYGPYTLSKNMAYYGGNNSKGSDSHPAQMITEACERAEAAGVDFSLYDVDKDGCVDNVFVYYAGYNEAEGGSANTIWPHRSRIVNSPTYGGKTISDYACTSELTGRSGNVMCGIGTFCHEFSHVLGLPDLYNTENSSTYTVGAWDIMSNGNYNNNGHTPPAYTAFERFMLGWLTPEQLTNPSDYSLAPLEQEARAYLIAVGTHSLNPSDVRPNEFWLIENRQHVGWDAPEKALPGVGLLITHITHSVAKWNNNTYNNRVPMGFDVCEAYIKNPHSSSPSDTYPGTMKITSFVPKPNGAEELYEHSVTNIRYSEGMDMVFHYGESSGYGFNLSPRSLPTITTEMLEDSLIYHVEKLAVSGEHLSGNAVIMSFSNKLFQLSKDGEHWYNQTVEPYTEDSTYNGIIYIRHVPSKQCTSSTGLLSLMTSDSVFSTQLSLRGYSPRAVLVRTVNTLPAEQVTPYTFVARWEEQKDAEFYYLTLHRLTEGSSVMTPTLAVTTFAAEGDNTATELFPTPAVSLTLSVSHSFLGEDIGGRLIIEGWDREWHVIDSLTLRPISPNRDYEWTFSDSRYVQFRFTYRHLGGSGSISVPKCTIALNRKIEAVYTGEDYIMYAPLDEAQLSGLQPNTEYSYQLNAMEEKGCEKHVTALGPATIVTTLRGAENTEKNLTVYVTKDKQVVVYLPVIPKETDHLMVYSSSGSLLEDVPLNGVLYQAHIPTERLTFGNIYCVQLVQPEAGSSSLPLSRKALWAKFLY